MKVQFSEEECHRMFEAVIDQLVELDLSKADRATLRRWRADDMTLVSPLMQHLAVKMNAEIQSTHTSAEVSPIKKPDWAE
jgi:hypothetical protein